MTEDKKEIRIRIKPGGAVEIDVSGVQGKQCKTLTGALEAALGTVTEQTLKPAYYEDETTTARENVQEYAKTHVKPTLGNKP